MKKEASASDPVVNGGEGPEDDDDDITGRLSTSSFDAREGHGQDGARDELVDVVSDGAAGDVLPLPKRMPTSNASGLV